MSFFIFPRTNNMVNRAIINAQNENRHQIIPYQRAYSIAGTVLAALTWIPEQARDQLVRDVATYISSTGGQSIRELTRYVGDQLSGFDGSSLQIAQEQIQNVGRQLAAQAQQAGVRARERIGELVNEEFETDAQLMEEASRNVQRDMKLYRRRIENQPDEEMKGMSFRNLPWKPHKSLKNRKQMKAKLFQLKQLHYDQQAQD